MAFDLSTDETTTNTMIEVLGDAFDQCTAAISAADATRSQIGDSWTQSRAATIFIENMIKWEEGVNKIKAGVMEMNNAMSTFRHRTAVLEEQNIMQATWTA